MRKLIPDLSFLRTVIKEDFSMQTATRRTKIAGVSLLKQIWLHTLHKGMPCHQPQAGNKTRVSLVTNSEEWHQSKLYSVK